MFIVYGYTRDVTYDHLKTCWLMLFQDAKMALNFCTETVLNTDRLIFKMLFLTLLVPKFTKTKRYLKLCYKMLPDECQ